MTIAKGKYWENKMEISVIMLTFNREKFVERMIKCILSQTFKDFEFIIVDNGSTDQSGEIADRYACIDERIRVIHRERGNIGSGRNTGLEISQGRYIAFVDDDDTCTTDYLQFLYQLAQDTCADISICGATWADIGEKHLMDAEEAIERLLWRKNYNVAFPTKLIRRELFVNNRFLESGKYDDIYLMPKIIADAEKIAYYGLSKYHFDRHGGNNSAWTQEHALLDAETLQEYLDVYRERTEWLIRRFPISRDKWQYFNWSFMISMIEKVSRFKLKECYEIRNTLIAELKTVYDKFYDCPWILDIEKEWMYEYVSR